MDTATTSAVSTWIVDPSRSQVEFTAMGFWGLSQVTGRFSHFDGTYTVDPHGSALELDVDAESLDSGNRLRDKHLRGADFFDVEEHPHVRFTSTHVGRIGDGALHVIGELEVAGERAELSFFAAERELGDELELEATTLLDQHALGMTHSPLGMVRRPATLHVKARLVPAF